MAASSPHRPRRLELWIVAILGVVWVSIGCTPATLSYLLMPFAPDKEDPQCKLAAKDKEVQVAIMCNFAKLETRSEILPAETELSDKLAQSMRERFKQNKEKVNIIPTIKVKSAMNRSGQDISPHEIGKQLKADYVVCLEINDIDLYERKSARQIFQGRADISINVFDVSKASGEANIFQDNYVGDYPKTKTLTPSDCSYQNFRAMFLTKVARDISRNFSAHYPDETRRMDD